MEKTSEKLLKRTRRHARIRARVIGTASRPRLAVFKSNRFVYAQLINDEAGTTLASADSRTMSGDTPLDKAKAVGAAVAKAAQEQKLEAVVFDRGGFAYQGVVAAVADGAREAGIKL